MDPLFILPPIQKEGLIISVHFGMFCYSSFQTITIEYKRAKNSITNLDIDQRFNVSIYFGSNEQYTIL